MNDRCPRWPDPMPVQPEERAVLKPRPLPDMPEWAEQNYVLGGKTASTAGPWSNEYTPYLVEIMRRLTQPGPVQVSIKKPSQWGGSELTNILICYTAEENPTPLQVVMPTKRDVEKRIETRIRTAFEANPKLLRHVKNKDTRNIYVGKQTSLDTMFLFLGWPTPSAMADISAGIVVLDELGKFPARVGKETSPVLLIKKRLRTWPNRKLVALSTPVIEGDLICSEYDDGDRCQWFVPCSHCGIWHVMRWKDVKIAKNDAGKFHPKKYYEKRVAAGYVCPHCKTQWSEIDRANANAVGKWIPEAVAIDPQTGVFLNEPEPTAHFSYHGHCLMIHPRFETVANLAFEWVSAQEDLVAGDTSGLQDFMNSQLGEGWKEVGRTVDANEFTDKIVPRPPRAVPTWARVLVVGADYHKSTHGNVRVDYEVAAFGTDMQNAVVLTGSATSLEDMAAEILFAPFPWLDPDETAEELAVLTVFIDAKFEAEDIYDFCSDPMYSGICFPINGENWMRKRMDWSDLEKIQQRRDKKYKTRKSRNYHGMVLVRIDVNKFKDIIMRYATMDKDQPAATTWYDSVPEHYFKELASEQRVRQKRGAAVIYVWTKKTGVSIGSHSLDTHVYAFAAAYWNKVNTWRTLPEMDQLPEAVRRRMNKRKVKLSEKPRRRR